MQKTPLNSAHHDAGARMVEFGGWEMPIHYGSQIDEHKAVRERAGMFDVSHMTVVDIEGADAQSFLRYLLANDVAKAKTPGRAIYGCMLNEQGGIIDDLITYFRGEGQYRLVVNAATRDADLAWIGKQAGRFDVRVSERPELAMVAVQGPQARELANPLLAAAGADSEALQTLRRFGFIEWGEWFVARTGYTGEDGYEVILPAGEADGLWRALLEAGVQPCGLGARDTLRLEAGLNLYGQDMDTSVTPYESNLGWTVALEPQEREFIGRDALLAQRQRGDARQLIGLVLEQRGVMRHGQVVQTAAGAGEVTSGTFSPSLGQSIAMARVPVGELEPIQVEIRGKALAAKQVAIPFVK